ncbi:MAG: site-2 protease family protein [Aggregatilineales bacterium]
MLLFGNPSIETLISILIAVGLGMTVHEFAHNYIGHLMGDPVPAREGRLTLNPLVHINWVGWLMFALIGFGILGSAPIAAHRMRRPRWGYLAAVAAGPLANLIVAAVFGLVFRLVVPLAVNQQIPLTALLLLQVVVYFNVLLFVFNILPFFPLDGWHIVLALLPPDLAYSWQRYQQYSYFAFFALILLSFVGGPLNILGILIGQPVRSIYGALIGF